VKADGGDVAGVVGVALVAAAFWSWWGWPAALCLVSVLVLVAYVARELVAVRTARRG
jgi:hypothetical protein